MELVDQIKEAQAGLLELGLYEGKVDGVAGAKTWSAISKLVALRQPETAKSDEAYVFDFRTELNLTSLTTATRLVAREFIHLLHLGGINAKIISATRTYEEQNALYEQGRSKPGNIVTNARGGYSEHNHGIAFDIGIFDHAGHYLEESPLYQRAGIIGKGLGLEWGGDWKFQDEPHFCLRPTWAAGLTDSEMLAKLRQDKQSQAA